MRNFCARKYVTFSCVIISLMVVDVTVAKAAADEVPDNAQLFQMIQSLRAKVALLEEQNARYRKEAEEARKEVQPVRKFVTRTSPDRSNETTNIAPTTVARRQPSVLYNTTKPVAAIASATSEPVDSWSGIYWGASFGAGAGRTKTSSSENYATNAVGAIPPDFVGTTVNSQGLPNNAAGAVVNLFIGANAELGERYVMGAQLEGTLADMNFGSRGLLNDTIVCTGCTTITGTGTFQPHISSRWMTSAVARGGWLADQTTLLYGLAGWTVAQFDAQTQTITFTLRNESDLFFANGPTMGGGIEKKLNVNWSLRAEYRYTHFGSRSVNDSSYLLQTTNTQAYSQHTSYNSDMQTGLIGVSYLVPVAR